MPKVPSEPAVLLTVATSSSLDASELYELSELPGCVTVNGGLFDELNVLLAAAN